MDENERCANEPYLAASGRAGPRPPASAATGFDGGRARGRSPTSRHACAVRLRYRLAASASVEPAGSLVVRRGPVGGDPTDGPGGAVPGDEPDAIPELGRRASSRPRPAGRLAPRRRAASGREPSGMDGFEAGMRPSTWTSGGVADRSSKRGHAGRFDPGGVGTDRMSPEASRPTRRRRPPPVRSRGRAPHP